MGESYPVARPTRHVLAGLNGEAGEAALGHHVLSVIRRGGIFVATPDALDGYGVVVGLREPAPEMHRPVEPRDSASILPWLAAAVL